MERLGEFVGLTICALFLFAGLAPRCDGADKALAHPASAATALPPDGSSGVAVVEVDPETGKVRHVRIERSSGSRRYDIAVIESLQKKTFPPHSEKEVRVPFSINAEGNFTQTDVGHYLTRHGIPASALVAAPAPRYPLSALMNPVTGRGRYELQVAPSGQVTAVKTIQSTGVGRLDNAAINALRNWRFRPGAVKTLVVPIHFHEESGYFRILLE